MKTTCWHLASACFRATALRSILVGIGLLTSAAVGPVGIMSAALAQNAVAKEPTAPAAQAESEDAEKLPPALETYKGRTIAQTMHYAGAEWLIRDTREREERCSLMFANLGLKPGMTVCDMGCGNGFYSLQMARAIGPEGKVLCVDIQPEMLQLLKQRAARARIDNIEPILGTVADPKLPEGKVDLILLVDVYHEFSHPEHMLRAMRRSLKPDGVIALLEYRGEDPEVPIKPLHKMTKEQIMKEYPANGFKLVREFERLPWQHMMFFARDESFREDTPLESPDAGQAPNENREE